MPIVEVEQGSAEWLAMRIGAVTASRMSDVMARLKTKNSEASVRQNYKSEIVCERLTGLACEHYVTDEMQWGIDNEPLAKAAYEIQVGSDISSGGLAMHPSIKWLMASPDGLVGDDGLVECKCPKTATHKDYILAGEVPPEYHWQILCQLACSERKYCDFISFDPRMPKELQLFVRRFERDNERIKQMEAEIVKFLAEVDEQIARLGKSTMVDLDPTLESKLKASLEWSAT